LNQNSNIEMVKYFYTTLRIYLSGFKPCRPLGGILGGHRSAGQSAGTGTLNVVYLFPKGLYPVLLKDLLGLFCLIYSQDDYGISTHPAQMWI